MPRSSRYGGGEPDAVDPRRVVGQQLDGGYFAAARSAAGSGPVSTEPIAGPLGVWREPTNRPYEQMGKFSFGLTGDPSLEAGGFSPFAVPTTTGLAGEPGPGQIKPPQPGFFESVFGGVAGVAGEVPGGIGRFLGSVLDLPFEAVGNVGGLITAPLSAAWQAARDEPLDPDLQKYYEDSVKENPINALLKIGEIARYQWERDVQAGRSIGLFGDIGPSANLWDTFMTAMNLVLVKPQHIIGRGIVGATGMANDRVAAAEEMAKGLTVEEKYYDDPFLVEVAEKLRTGYYGPLGSEQARNMIRDDMVRNGGLTGNFVGDLMFSLVTDPWIILSLGVGTALKTAHRGALAATDRFWQAIKDPIKLERGFDSVIGHIAERGNISREAAERLYQTDPMVKHDAQMWLAGQDEFKEFAPAMREGATFMQKWTMSWEPALRPVFNVVDKINQFPFFGRKKTPSADLMQTTYNRHSTQGVVEGLIGLPGFAAVSKKIREVSPEVWGNLENGLGIFAANMIRLGQRPELVRRALGWGIETVDRTIAPTPLIEAGLTAVRGADLAVPMEIMAARYKMKYLALEAGGEGAAMTAARTEATERLVKIGMVPDDARALADGMGRDEIAFIDAAYFGHIVGTFMQAARSAPRRSQAFVKHLTVIGPRQLTEQRAAQLLEAIAQKDDEAVRQAMARYDLLYENLNDTGLSDAALRERVELIVKDQAENNALPKELDSASRARLPASMKRWLDDNETIGGGEGYLIGEKPDEVWRPTFMDETNADGVVERKLAAINPWIDFTDRATEALGEVSQVQAWKNRFFREIRGQRIMYDARQRLARMAADKYGFTQGDSDALFAMVLKAADEGRMTPRGLSGGRLWKLVQSLNLPAETKDKVNQEEIVEMILTAFKGEFWHTGMSQAFTGAAKVRAGRGNWLGVIAEDIYPKVRYLYNPVFQLQELIEPFFLNVMRGVLPGTLPGHLDNQTLDLINVVIHKSQYAADDMVERGVTQLMDLTAAKMLGKTRIGRVIARMLRVREVKLLNYARLQRKMWGEEFKAQILDMNPAMWRRFEAAYRTTDPGQIAVRFMSERLNLKMRNPEWRESLFRMMKPDHLGRREPVVWDHLVGHMPDDFGVATGSELRAALRFGAITRDSFDTILRQEGATPEYIANAYRQAVFPELDEYWDQWERLNPGTSGRIRSMVQRLADNLNMSELDYLSTVHAGAPAGAAAEDLAHLTARQRAGYEFFVDLRREAIHDEPPSPLAAAKRDFVDKTRNDDFETEWLLDPVTGDRVAIWKDHRTGDEYFERTSYDNGGLNPLAEREAVRRGPSTRAISVPDDAYSTISPVAGGRVYRIGGGTMSGKVFIHHHPGPGGTGLSVPDVLTSGIFGDSAEVVATPRGLQSSMSPPSGGKPGERWFTPEFTDAVQHGFLPWVKNLAYSQGEPRIMAWADSLMQTGIPHRDFGEEEYYALMQYMHIWLENELDLDTQRYYRAIQNITPTTAQYNELRGEEDRIWNLATDMSLDKMAETFGWTYRKTWDAPLPERDLTLYRRALEEAEPPDDLILAFKPGDPRRQQKSALQEIPLLQYNANFEVNPYRGTLWAEIADWDNLSPEVRATVTEAWEPFIREEAQRLFSVRIEKVLSNTEGSWIDGGVLGVSPNISWRVYGTKQQVEAVLGFVGYGAHQNETLASRVSAWAGGVPATDDVVNNVAAGERWGVDVWATHDDGSPITGEELAELGRRLTPVMGEVGWGSSEVVMADGTRSVRYILDWDPVEQTRAQFHAAVDYDGLAERVRKVIEDLPDNLHVQMDDYLYHVLRSKNDWAGEGANGATHLAQVESRTGGQIRGSVVRQRLGEATPRFIAAIRASLDDAIVAARAGTDAHAAAVAARDAFEDRVFGTVGTNGRRAGGLASQYRARARRIRAEHGVDEAQKRLAALQALPAPTGTEKEIRAALKVRAAEIKAAKRDIQHRTVDAQAEIGYSRDPFLTHNLTLRSPAPPTAPRAVYLPDDLGERGRQGRGLTLHDQHQLSGQQMDAVAFYQQETRTYMDLMEAIWATKERFETDIVGLNPATTGLDRYMRSLGAAKVRVLNALMAGALTANTALPVSEFYYRRVRLVFGDVLSDIYYRHGVPPGPADIGRVRPMPNGSEQRVTVEGQYLDLDPNDVLRNRVASMKAVLDEMPEYLRDDDEWLGVAVQIRERALVGAGALADLGANRAVQGLTPDFVDAMWLTEMRLEDAIQRRLQAVRATIPDDPSASWGARSRIRAKQDAAVDQAAPQIIREETDRVRAEIKDQADHLLHDRGVVVYPHPPSGQAQLPYGRIFVTNPLAPLRPPAATSGRIARWFALDLFGTSAPMGWMKFIEKRSWESRDEYMWRLGSVLPGMGGKTSSMSLSTLGPAYSERPPIDIWEAQSIVIAAMDGGYWDEFAGSLTPQYRALLESRWEDFRRGLPTERFPGPEAKALDLGRGMQALAKTDPKEAVRRMRKRLQESDLLTAHQKRFYNDDTLLMMATLADNPKILVYEGSDYEAMVRMLDRKRQAEAAVLAETDAESANRMLHWSLSQYQWHDWGQIRGGREGSLDPHLIYSKDVESIPRLTDLEGIERVKAEVDGDPYGPEATFDTHARSMDYLDDNGVIRGFNAILEDDRTIQGFTQFTNPEAALHESMHPFVKFLHPSQKQSLTDAFNAATGKRKRAFDGDVSEWFVRQAMNAVEGETILDPAVKETLGLFSRFLRAATRKEARTEQMAAVAAARKQAVEEAEQAVKDLVAPGRSLAAAVQHATEVRDRAVRDLKSARGLLSVEELARRRTEAEAGFKAGTVTKAARARAIRAHNAAQRRKPVAAFEKALEDARAQLQAAQAALSDHTAKVKAAQRALDKARAGRGRPARLPYTPPTVNPEVQRVLDGLFPLERIETRPGSGVEAASPFSLDQEAYYQAALQRLLQSENNAFTTHYYRRGRSFVERSINHQYFGLYPASYMWGKVLPEMLRFLLKEPFGIRAPLGGLALANQIHRAMIIRQNYDEDFRQFMVDNTDAWRFMSLLTPALPWEIPVNAPMWLRRAAEWDATREARIAAGERREDVPRLTGAAMANIVRDMAEYAIGPIQSLKYVGGAIGQAEDLGSQFGSMVQESLSGAGEQVAAQVEQFQPFQPQGLTSPPP